MARRAALIAALTTALAVPRPADAALVTVAFTGTVQAGSYDLAGTIYGQGVSGQVGDTISGSYLIDTAAILDAHGSPNIGIWGAPGNPIPQPFSFLSGQYTIDGVTIQTGQHLAQPNGHSVEVAAVFDMNPAVNPQDSLSLSDGSQLLLCADPLNAIGCNGGSQADSIITINAFGNLDWLQNETLEQSFSLDSTGIATLLGAGGGASGQYFHWRTTDTSPFPYQYDARGSFALTSLSFTPFIEEPIGTPEPASLALFGLALAAFAGRQRSGRQRSGARTSAHRNGSHQ